MKKTLVPVWILFISLNLQAQNLEIPVSSHVDSINSFILNYLETTDVGFIWGGPVSQDKRLGFIGEEYQRFQIHFNSIIQNYDNPYEYFVYGKTKVRDNICEFQGSLIISEISYEKDEEHPDLNTAYLAGDYVLFEDQACLHSGIFRGEFISFVYIAKDSIMYYNDLDNEKPSYSNNLFTGEWFHYESDLVQICNWGDNRIPGAADLDIGSNEFKPSYRFLENGWSGYLKETETGEKEEQIPWWE